MAHQATDDTVQKIKKIRHEIQFKTLWSILKKERKKKKKRKKKEKKKKKKIKKKTSEENVLVSNLVKEKK